ncbi:MAG: site-specific integrase [Methyloprofundus sp.]|nr:site-specific integrase [Methyloprofundus sp.]
MSIVENIHYTPMIFDQSNEKADFGFIPDALRKPLKAFPQLFFSNGEPWREVNQYAFYRYFDLSKDLKTVSNEMSMLQGYADWLEDQKLHWLHFPKVKRERCIYKYRGYLIQLRDEQLIAPSTASLKMNAVIAFYRWASTEGLAEARNKLFDEKVKTIQFFDKVGFSRTFNVTSTDLSIPNRARSGATLEDGLLPLSKVQNKILMSYLASQNSYELYLIHKVSLLTGGRFETVTTLTIDSLSLATPDPQFPSVMRVRVGPGTSIKTKFNVSGSILFPIKLIDELVAYFESTQAILRRSKASTGLQKNVFLTNRGNQYTVNSFGTIMHRLREGLVKKGHAELANFHFHQLRATFGTMLMTAVLDSGIKASNAIVIVRDALLHKDDSTTWKYIKFIEREPLEETFTQTLWDIFTGNEAQSSEGIQAYLDYGVVHDKG